MKLILLIDDNELFRVTLSEWLKLEGFDSITAADGLHGLQLAKQLQPDLILCDLDMPDIDGIETLKRIRAEESTAKIPFLFLTASYRLRDKDVQELGADGLVSKLGAPDELRKILKRYR
jgi:CheY-like chemotaxis protein